MVSLRAVDLTDHIFPCSDQILFYPNGGRLSLWNTITNLAYIIAGLYGLYRTHAHPRSKLEEWSISIRDINLLYSFLIVIGFCSAIYHGSLQPWSFSVDFFSIQMTIILFLSILQPKAWLEREIILDMLGLVVVVTAATCVISLWLPWLQQFAFYLHLFVVGYGKWMIVPDLWERTKHVSKKEEEKLENRIKVLSRLRMRNIMTDHDHQELIHATRVRDKYKAAVTGGRPWLLRGFIAFSVALVFYIVPVFWCSYYRDTDFGAFFQSHAFWHILSSYGLFCYITVLLYLKKID